MSKTQNPDIRGVSRVVDPHLAHRKDQEALCQERSARLETPLKSILTIELNITELCNRKCIFCPRIDPKIYPNRNLNMEIGLVQRLSSEVKRLGIWPRFSFSGFGEPVLNKALPDFINHIRSELPDHTIEINTNGDRLTVDKVRSLFAAGLTYLYINLYDGPEQAEGFHQLMIDSGVDKSRYQLRPHWVGAEGDYGLTLNNRSGTVNSPTINLLPLKQKLERRCHYPFYKLLLDWNGDVLFCSNDWGRQIVVGNLMSLSLDEIWLSPILRDIRMRLLHGDRSQSPCNTCNVNGLITGSNSVRVLLGHYLAKEEITPNAIPVDIHPFS
jgi:radical SAM protein with 4Fe4S-binding SPASM domain